MAASFDSSAGRLTRKMFRPRRVRHVKPVWDKSVYDTLVSHIGVGRVDDSLRLFSAALTRNLVILQDDNGDVPRQRYEIHDLASTSGFLGFVDLFRACLKLLAGNGVPALRRDVVASEIVMALGELTPYLAGTPRAHQISGHNTVSGPVIRAPVFA